MNKGVNHWFFPALLLGATTAHAANNEPSFDITLNRVNGCSSLSVGFSLFSDHTTKGDRNGLLNQTNRGKVAECFFDKNRNFYSITGALQNSQWGPTLLHGYGFRMRTPELWRLSAEGGYEVALTYYEQGCPTRGPYARLGCPFGQRSIVAPLPMLYVGANARLPSMSEILSPFLTADERIDLPRYMNSSMGELTVGRRTLGAGLLQGKEKIYLYTITWTQRF